MSIRMTGSVVVAIKALVKAHEGGYGAEAQQLGLYGLQLCEIVRLPSGTVVPVLARLAANGLATRHEMERRVYYRITEKGQRTLTKKARRYY
jgi:DNA-binding PadR family transcriptional regulator